MTFIIFYESTFHSIVKYIFFFLLLTVTSKAQIELDSSLNQENKISYSDTALYDVYGLNYKVSQPIKYIVQHSTTGAALALSYWSLGNLSGAIDDEMGIGFMAMPIIGGSIGLLSGTIYGIYKGSVDTEKKETDKTFYHEKGKYGYEFGLSSTSSGNKFSLHNSITIRAESAEKYFPDVLSLNFEYSRWNGAVHNANELKYGADGKYYFSNYSFFNSFYGVGFGISSGMYWDSWRDIHWQVKANDKHHFLFVYANAYVGFGLNVFDFLNVNTAVVVEPLNAKRRIRPEGFASNEIFAFKISAGSTFF